MLGSNSLADFIVLRMTVHVAGSVSFVHSGRVAAVSSLFWKYCSNLVWLFSLFSSSCPMGTHLMTSLVCVFMTSRESMYSLKWFGDSGEP